MCDYSLEVYRSRPAVTGERYETHRFATGTIGFVAPGDTSVAVCMACDTRLALSDLPESVQKECGVGAQAEAIFTRLEAGPHHDGIRFANGSQILLQRLGTGVKADVLDTLSAPRSWTRRLLETV